MEPVSVSPGNDPSAFLPAALGTVSPPSVTCGEEEWFCSVLLAQGSHFPQGGSVLQRYGRRGPQPLAPPCPLTRGPGRERGPWRSRRRQDNARNDSSAMMNLACGSQVRENAADFPVVSGQMHGHRLVLRGCFFGLFFTFVNLNVLNKFAE